MTAASTSPDPPVMQSSAESATPKHIFDIYPYGSTEEYIMNNDKSSNYCHTKVVVLEHSLAASL
jgi:hypothetical protein